MVKIRISYEYPEELQEILKELKKSNVLIKIPKQQNGRFKKVYLEVK